MGQDSRSHPSSKSHSVLACGAKQRDPHPFSTIEVVGEEKAGSPATSARREDHRLWPPPGCSRRQSGHVPADRDPEIQAQAEKLVAQSAQQDL